MVIDPNEVARAVEILEASPIVELWEITKISNPNHAELPAGPGVRIMVQHQAQKGKQVNGALMYDVYNVFEKAGAGVTLVDAAQKAVARLGQRIGAVGAA